MKPLLAGKVESVDKLRYPVIASPKVDGIRCLIVDGKPVSRKLKDIPNRHIHSTIVAAGLANLDGELIVPGAPFNETSSAVMSEDGKPHFRYLVFDTFAYCDEPYAKRLLDLRTMKLPYFAQTLEFKIIENAKDLLTYEDLCITEGYEGVMVRSPEGRYKLGRSTTNEQILLKLKRFEDSEAVLIGGIEEQHNGNAATVDELGHTKRSSHKANLKGKGCLGAFRCRRPDGLEFEIGTGFSAEQRDLYWRGLGQLIGKTVVYKHQPSGAKDKPRFPVFKGFRHKDDI